MVFDFLGKALRYLSTQGQEELFVLPQVSSQGDDAFIRQRGVLAALKLAEIRMVDPDASSNGSNGISIMLLAKLRAAFLKITS